MKGHMKLYLMISVLILTASAGFGDTTGPATVQEASFLSTLRICGDCPDGASAPSCQGKYPGDECVLAGGRTGACKEVSFCANRAVCACELPHACIDVYDPVICSNGEIYANACYAYQAGATGCIPWSEA